MRRSLTGIHIGTVFVGLGILLTGLVTAQTLLLVMGNVFLLIGTAVRSAIAEQGREDEAVAQFQRAIHFLVPRWTESGRESDPLTSCSWVHRLRGLGLLYWIDRGTIIALSCLVIWLVWLAVHDVAHAPALAILLTAVLWGLRVALRILWSVRQIRHAGKGSILAGVRNIRRRYEEIKLYGTGAVEALVNRILGLHQNGDLAGALAEADRLVKLRPEMAVAYCLKGNVLVALGQYEEAMSEFGRAIECDGSNAQAYRYRGVTWMRLRMWKEAREDLSKAVDLSRRGDTRALLALAELYSTLGEYRNATDVYTEAIECSESPEAYMGRAQALIELSRFDDAIADCTAAIEGHDGMAIALRGWAKMLLGNYAEAVADFKAGLGASDLLEASYVHYGYAWLLSTCATESLRDEEAALCSATRVAELDQFEHWEIERLFAAVYANRGQFDVAAAHQQRAVDEAPDWAIARLEQQLQKFRSHEAIRGVEENTGRVLPLVASKSGAHG